jgi:KaiC/GvpD/RAD55 family RecA-like ATPase
MVSIAHLYEIPPRNLILLVGPPGAGKSTFCQQAVLRNLAMDRLVVYVTTEYGPSQAEEMLSEKGLGRIEPGLLSFVDTYNETGGVSVKERLDTVQADCSNMSSIDIVISRLGERVGRKGLLLVFDSLTSPYRFSGSEILRFITQTLSRFAAISARAISFIHQGSCSHPLMNAGSHHCTCFMGSPQQTSSPTPDSKTLTLLPQISQR